MVDEDRLEQARRIGRDVAREAEALRRTTMERNEALRSQALALRSEAAADSRLARLALTDEAVPTLIAEGDSWFDYPGPDILDLLEDVHGYQVRSVAHRGHRLEDMAYDPRQLFGFAREVDKLAGKGTVPVAVLLSAGGNDVAGHALDQLLDHARSPSPGLNEEIVHGIIDVRLREAYVSLITAMTDLCELSFEETVPVLVHGYGYAVPDGRGFFGGWGPLPGPWLRPSFRHKGYPDEPLEEGTQIIAQLIDRFNDMLSELTTALGHVRFVDLRPFLSNGEDYKDSWANELHPRRRGFEAVTGEIARVLSTV